MATIDTTCFWAAAGQVMCRSSSCAGIALDSLQKCRLQRNAVAGSVLTVSLAVHDGIAVRREAAGKGMAAQNPLPGVARRYRLQHPESPGTAITRTGPHSAPTRGCLYRSRSAYAVFTHARTDRDNAPGACL